MVKVLVILHKLLAFNGQYFPHHFLCPVLVLNNKQKQVRGVITSLANESLFDKFVGFNRTLVGLLCISHVFPSPCRVQMIRVGKIHKT